jgi:two-component system, OmpR family, KDP operon response regulator KdpE
MSAAPLKILVVDDEPPIRKLLRRGWESSSPRPWRRRLLARIRAALRHQLQAHGERPIFRTGDLSVDLVRRIVKVGDKEVKLSPKEYDLLRVLVQHAGKVLTHKFLLGELWDALTDAQYLRVYVRQLRQKIEADPERPQYVLTETGIGYRLRAPEQDLH